MGSQRIGTALLSPIRRMSVELDTEIISYVLASGMDKQQIASVCKSWKKIVLNTGRFWRDIIIDHNSCTPASLKRLKRALELSGTVTLAVNLEFYSYYSRHQLLEHLGAVIDAGIHRWQSLHLTGGLIFNNQSNPIAELFRGNFSSLRSLSVSHLTPSSGEQNIFEPIYRLIAKTCPGLHQFSIFSGDIPESLAPLSIYGNLTSITATAGNIAKVRPKFDVPNLHIKGFYSREVKAIELPHTTTFDRITIAQLSKCGPDHVEVLEVWSLLDGRNEDSKTVRFPNLQTLHIHVNKHDNMPWLLFSEAPRLSHLRIIDLGLPNLDVMKDFIEQVFNAGKHRIKISPARLDLELHLSVAMTLCVLKHWSQVQDLTLYWDENINWNGMLLRVLCDTDGKENGGEVLCPDLRLLRIVMWRDWPQKLIGAWLKVARRILKARKKALPLWKITLTSRGGVPISHSITIFDIK